MKYTVVLDTPDFPSSIASRGRTETRCVQVEAPHPRQAVEKAQALAFEEDQTNPLFDMREFLPEDYLVLHVLEGWTVRCSEYTWRGE